MMPLPMSRRRFLSQSGKVIAGASLAGLFLGACDDQRNPTGVQYWYGLDDSQQRQYFITHDIDAFNRTHSGLPIQMSFKPSSDVDRLIQTALPAGRGPDLVPSPGPSDAMQYIDAHLLMDLTPYAEKYKWQSKLLPWAYATGQVHGKLYALPGSYQTLVIFYNKTLFQQKGWAIPTNREELEALCEEAMGQGIMPFIAGNADSPGSSEWYTTMFLNHYAGPDAVYQALTGQVQWTDPIFVEAIDLLRTYFQKGWFGGGVQQYFTNSFNQLDSAFASGKAAMDMEGSWAFSNWPSYFGPGLSSDEYDWFPIPPLRTGVPQNLYVIGAGSTISIKADSKVADKAAQYLDWLYSTPTRVGQEVADQGDAPLPIHLTASDFPASIDPRIKDHYLKLFQATAVGNFGYTTWTFWPPNADLFAYQGLDKVLAGLLTPAQFCQQMNTIFQRERSQGVVPSIPKGKA